MKTKALLLIGTIVLLIATYSCSKENETPDTALLKAGRVSSSFTIVPENELPADRCGENEYDLIAGQYLVSGNISVFTNGGYIYISFKTNASWLIQETHVYIGPQSGIPVNKSGVPVPGHFPYNNSFTPAVSEITYMVSLDDIVRDENGCFIIAAHAVVDNGEVTETAWGNGISFEDAFGIDRWGYISEYCLQECDECVFDPMVVTVIRKNTTVGDAAFNGAIGDMTIVKDVEHEQYILTFKLLDYVSFFSTELNDYATGYWGFNNLGVDVTDLEGNILFHTYRKTWNPTEWMTREDVIKAINSYQISFPFSVVGDNECFKIAFCGQTKLMFYNVEPIINFEDVTICHATTEFLELTTTVCQCQ